MKRAWPTGLAQPKSTHNPKNKIKRYLKTKKQKIKNPMTNQKITKQNKIKLHITKSYHPSKYLQLHSRTNLQTKHPQPRLQYVPHPKHRLHPRHISHKKLHPKYRIHSKVKLYLKNKVHPQQHPKQNTHTKQENHPNLKPHPLSKIHPNLSSKNTPYP